MAELYKGSDLMIFRSQKIHSGSTVGTDHNGGNLEPGRTIKKLLCSARKEMLSS